MANRTAPGSATSEKLDPENLDSPMLRLVLEHYGDGRMPNHVVAASAVFRAEKIIKAKMAAALASLDLAPDRYQVLGLLANAEGGKMSLSDLSRAVLIHPATTTYTVDTLEKRGLIKRQSDPKDRRGVLAQVTPAGRELVRKATKMLEGIDWGIGELTDEEAIAISRALSRLHPS
jgi:DNA-binding MarR family transcriptional regulator